MDAASTVWLPGSPTLVTVMPGNGYREYRPSQTCRQHRAPDGYAVVFNWSRDPTDGVRGWQGRQPLPGLAAKK
jgi:hypothetical protein